MLNLDSPLRESQKDDNIERDDELKKEEKRYSRMIEWI
jgi:hypothetical protein